MKNTLEARTWFRLAVIVGVVLTLGGIARHTAVRAAPGNGVKIMPNGRAPDDNPGERGATYYALEAQTSRFTTRFHDGTTAVAERTADGDIETKLRDLGGNEINRFKVGHDKLMYLRPSATPVQAVPDSGVHATFDWSNRQSHRLFEDGVASGAGLEWRDGLMRHTSARGKDEEAAVVREVETRWAHGLSARTARVRARRGDVFDGKPLQGDVLATILMRDGVEVGLANYLTYERVFVWTIPGMSEGSIGNDHLKQQFNGWPFTPDMVWMNLQTIALYHWKETITQKGFVARCDQPQPNPLVQFFVPTVSANEVGCDGLHWLDHTVMRYCCDSHDNCYERDGCAYKSWWMFWSSWRCDFCNILAIRCFQTGAIPTGKIRRPPAAPVDY